ncbi:MAG: glycosyltransferase family 2 protein [Cyclobacteriaceae bacterium]|nr:glycosyltransferase family 2 protein [Cyclobacteriaceae bacterium]
MGKFEKNVSLVIPVFNEEESLPELHAWIRRVLDQHALTGEIILIDDGCTDGSWNIISELSDKDPDVVGIRFTRNYGKSAALHTGFQQARGEVVITLDADLQDSPDEIPGLVHMIREEGWQLVSGWKKRRHDPLEKTIPSRFFNYITRVVSGIRLHDFNCGLKAYQNQLVKNITVYGELHRYIPMLAKWNGYTRIGERVVEHHARKYGKTKFGFERYIKGFLDLLSITFMTRFSKNPMHLFGSLGTLSFLSGFGITAFIIGDKLYRQYHQQPVRDVVEQPLFFLSLIALLVGVQLFLTGFLAEMTIQNNPNKSDYLIAEKRNA